MRLSAVDERDPFLWRERHRFRTNGLEYFVGRLFTAVADQSSFTNQREREMSEWSEVTAGADAALLRDTGIHVGIQHLERESDERRPCTRVSLRNDVGAQKHHRARLSLQQSIAYARRMAHHRMYRG